MSPSAPSSSSTENNNPDLNEIGHYVVTSHPPGSVFSSIKCSFLSDNSSDVVIAKSNRLEVRQFQHPSGGSLSSGGPSTSGGDYGGTTPSANANDDASLFPLMLSLPVNGRIMNIAPVRFANGSNNNRDCIFFTTEKGGYALISYDESLLASSDAAANIGNGATDAAAASEANATTTVLTGEHYPIKTHASGSFKNYSDHVMSGGRISECGPLLAVDHLFRCIALHVYDGYVTVIPINRGYEVNKFKRRAWRRNADNGKGVLGTQPGTSVQPDNIMAGSVDGAADITDDAGGNSLAGGSGKMPAAVTTKQRGLSAGPFSDPFHVRIEERTVLSMTFLQPISSSRTTPPSRSSQYTKSSQFVPQLALLHQDCRGVQHVISHGLDLSKKSLIMNGANAAGNNPRNARNMGSGDDRMGGGTKRDATNMPPVGERLRIREIEGGSGCLIPVPPPSPKNGGGGGGMDDEMKMGSSDKSSGSNKSSSKSLGGVIILGQRQITYHSTSEGATRIRPTGGALLLSHARVLESEFLNSPNDENHIVRYLIGDERGRIHLLSLMRKNGLVTTLHFDTLGTAATSSSLVYLGRGMVYVGSQFGNSQLIQILDKPIPTGTVCDGQWGMDHPSFESMKGSPLEDTTYVKIVEEYDNLGPIVDFDVRPCSDDDNGGNNAATTTTSAAAATPGLGTYRQSVVVTCSGVAKDGTVRCVRNGVGMREHAAVEIGGIKGMWSLRKKFYDVDDAYLVQSFVRETRMLGVHRARDVEMDEDDAGMEEEGSEEEEGGGGGALAEVTIPGFEANKSTLFAGNLLVVDDGNGKKFDLLLQVVADGVRLIDSETLALVSSWSPFSGDEGDSDDDDEPMGFITVASANECGQIVVALRGGALVYLLVEGGGGGPPSIRRVKRVTLDREISCINLNPFGSSSSSDGNADDSMDVDNADATTNKSLLVAVGLWDDFSVRLLNLSDDKSTVLDQVLHINLGRGGNEGGTSSQPTLNDATDSDEHLGDQSGQHMMARSLCLVSMDSQSTGSSIISKNTSSASKAGNNSVDMLLVGLGDGKLISFVVTQQGSTWSIHSRKEVRLGQQGVHLIPFKHGASSSASSDGSQCVLATGDRPTVVYLTGGAAGGSCSNPKLNYSTISLTVDEDDDDDEDGNSGGHHASHKNVSVNVATPFRSSLLFSTSASNAASSSLCIADENTLRLGMIDDIQKLHVTTYNLGMTPRRLCYHEAGRVYCVGCIASVEHGGEANMNNVVRFFDDSTFEELSCIPLEPFEMILTIESVYLSINMPPRDGTPASIRSDAVGKDDASGGKTTGLRAPPSADPASPVEYRPFIVMGTAYSYPDEDEPSQGRVIVVECNSGTAATGNLKSDDQQTPAMVRHVHQVADLPLMGGIYSIAPFYGGNILVTCGSKTVLCQLASSLLKPGELLLNHIGSGHHGHIISLYVKSLVNSDKSLQKRSDQKRQYAIVGDLMRSIALVEYYPKHCVIEELARDYNSNYCTEIAMLTNNIYMGSEGYNNLFVLQYNPRATTEQARVRLDTVGQYHLGEMVNKMIGGSLVMPSSNTSSSGGGGSGVGAATTGESSPDKSSYGSSESNRKVDITIGSSTLYGTVDGTIGTVLGLGGKTFAFLTCLQRAMDAIVRPVGDLSHAHYRAWEQDQKRHGACGFIDGDWIETFLDLNRVTMERVVREMNRDTRWRIRDDGKGFETSDDHSRRQNLMDTDDHHHEMGGGADGNAADASNSSDAGDFLTVEDVLGVVEELSMLH